MSLRADCISCRNQTYEPPTEISETHARNARRCQVKKTYILHAVPSHRKRNQNCFVYRTFSKKSGSLLTGTTFIIQEQLKAAGRDYRLLNMNLLRLLFLGLGDFNLKHSCFIAGENLLRISIRRQREGAMAFC